MEEFSGVKLQIYSFGSGRPRVLITAGIHGDEATGVYAAHRLIDHLKTRSLRGEVVVIPIVNPLGFQARIRYNPVDNVDLNRVFPEGAGSPVTRWIVSRVWEEATNSDYVVDLHCAGLTSYQYVLALHETLPHVRRFVEKVPWGVVVESSGLRGQLFIEAAHRGISSVIIETVGGRGYCDFKWGNLLGDVLVGLLVNLGVLEGEAKRVKQEMLGRIRRVQSPRSGFFKLTVKPGDRVKKGTTIGFVGDAEVKSEASGIIVSSASGRYVFKGEAAAGVAEERQSVT